MNEFCKFERIFSKFNVFFGFIEFEKGVGLGMQMPLQNAGLNAPATPNKDVFPIDIRQIVFFINLFPDLHLLVSLRHCWTSATNERCHEQFEEHGKQHEIEK